LFIDTDPVYPISLLLLADIYWAGLLTPEIILILFNDKTVQFPGDFVNFQGISRRKNNSSRFPGVLDTL